ncbi:hypothetical protein HDE_10249 [Halotydeus destructor]|nr:hypothetical protein HDE_10249 [Halotydeus destructor]
MTLAPEDGKHQSSEKVFSPLTSFYLFLVLTSVLMPAISLKSGQPTLPQSVLSWISSDPRSSKEQAGGGGDGGSGPGHSGGHGAAAGGGGGGQPSAHQSPLRTVGNLPQCLVITDDNVPSLCETTTTSSSSSSSSSSSTINTNNSETAHNCRLAYCDRFTLRDILPSWTAAASGLPGGESKWNSNSNNATNCHHQLSMVMSLEAEARRRVGDFEALLQRYNCQSGYSVKWDCSECSKTYRDWTCAMLIPFYVMGSQVKPCRSVCERIEERCPYFHPSSKEQYAGEPVFICIDPHIPVNHELMPDALYGEPGQCFDIFHLSSDYHHLPHHNDYTGHPLDDAGEEDDEGEVTSAAST